MLVPGAAPLPWQFGHATATLNGTFCLTPCAASTSSISTSATTSAPRAPRRPPPADLFRPPRAAPRPGRAAAPAAGAEDVVAEERREEVADRAEVERGRP